MQNTDISMPIAKATSAITVAAAAQTDVADMAARELTKNSTFETWMWVNSIPWGTVASIVAVVYTCLLIFEWFWKKLWRPVFERKGWIKPRKRYIITAQEYNAMTETQRADL